MANHTHDTIVPYKDSRLGKKEQIAGMFDHIAFRYDFLNHFLSGGIDRYWRRRAIRELQNREASQAIPSSQINPPSQVTLPSQIIPPQIILDVATGTADMPILLARQLPGARITGIDISNGMLGIGRKKVSRMHMDDRISLTQGDCEALQFADKSFDAVTVAFGVRNFANLEKGLGEMLRVLRPGGKVLILEFSQPPAPGIRRLFDLYTRLVACRIGRMISRDKEAYRYLNDSVAAFPEGEAMLDILQSCGYRNTRFRRLSLGICSLYIGERP
jgi:demethylmenaquinone methyltransferase / 2-methoxy-6-polyprenyl-1,4-benzoquinol methylase